MYKVLDAYSPARCAEGASDLFPFGAIPAAQLQDWLRRTRLVLPSDLIELWQLTGGGDVFESETIFRPTFTSTPNNCFVGERVEDDIEGRNTVYAKKNQAISTCFSKVRFSPLFGFPISGLLL